MAFFYEAKPLAENAFSWSITASSNDVADPAVPWPEGMLPGAVNNAARALMAGVARLIADLNGTIATGGSAGSYTITSNSGHTALTNGILVSARASATNTAGATLNFNTLGAKSIRVMAAGAEASIAAGQIVSGGTYQFRYDTAANSAAGGWVLLNPEPDPTMLVSVGDIKLYPVSTNTPPTGWLMCSGATISRTTFAALFAVIGETYGAGDGSTTFKIPDFRGRTPFGKDNLGGVAAANRLTTASGVDGQTIGAAGGLETIVLDSTMIPSHTHAGTTSSGGVDHTHNGGTGNNNVDHSHTVAPGTPSTTNGTFTGPGSTGWGGAVGTATTSGQSAVHQHAFTTDPASAFLHTHTFTTGSTGGGLLHNNMPPAIVQNFCIKF